MVIGVLSQEVASRSFLRMSVTQREGGILACVVTAQDVRAEGLHKMQQKCNSRYNLETSFTLLQTNGQDIVQYIIKSTAQYKCH